MCVLLLLEVSLSCSFRNCCAMCARCIHLRDRARKTTLPLAWGVVYARIHPVTSGLVLMLQNPMLLAWIQ